jgi:hypothetical protein
MSPILELPSIAQYGSSTEALPGSGTAVPIGIEAPMEYNGFVFNLRHLIDKIRVTKLDGLGDADIRDVREENPSSDGETPLDAYYGGRTIAITGRIEAYGLEKLRDMQQQLRQAFATVQTEYPLIFHGAGYDPVSGIKAPSLARTSLINCRKNQPITMTEEQNDFRFFRDFLITLRASNPRFLAYLPHITQFTATGASITDVSVFSSPNAGNYGAQPQMKFIGPITNPTLTNTRSGEFIKLVGTIPGGSTYIMDTAAKTFLDQSGTNRFSMLSVDSSLFQIYPGQNDIHLTATGMTSGTSQVIFTYSDTWI